MRALPIDALLGDIVATLSRQSRLVLRAPPGAGKTTRVPAALLDAGLAGDKQVVVLEPRRIAARAAAEFVAGERGRPVGTEVGYRVRFEQRGGPATRLWFVTEGVLGRQLVRDPFLEDVGIIVLDEFHERHVQGDVALAVVRALQESVRTDLKLLVMSATLDTEPLAAYLGQCPVVTSAGKTFPVRIEYDEPGRERPVAARVAAALGRVLATADDAGDVLVFLPGAAEIRRVAAAIAPLCEAYHLTAIPLHGDLPLDAQRRALQPGPQRKIVLSTNVAETALTIEGVTTVIDTGLAREARFDATHGINALRLVTISRAAAEQRAGRAGRTAPGRCIRLWAQAEHAHRRARETPEVLRLDLSGTVLELRAWGLADLRNFHWLDAPQEAALQRADTLLRMLGAVNGAHAALTAIGRRMLTLSVAPRLARILVEAEARGCAGAGALVAALASERDILLEQRAFGGEATSRWPAGPSDLVLRMQLFEDAARRRFDRGACDALGLDPRAVRAVERTRRQLTRAMGVRGVDDSRAGAAEVDVEALLRCTLAGFPDRVVRRRAGGSSRGVMVGGSGVVRAQGSVVRESDLFVAIEADAGARRERAETRVRIASAIEQPWLEQMFPGSVRTIEALEFDADRERVVARRRVLFQDLALDETVRLAVERQRAGEVLAEAARRDPARAARIGPPVGQLLMRIRFLRRWLPELAFGDPDALLADAVTTGCSGVASFAELRKIDIAAILRGLLTAPQLRALERDAPGQYRLPSGRLATIRYDKDKPPAVAARIQELFGLTATPQLAGGRVALVFELLAPNQRPAQVTDDLASFWRQTYPEVRKQLRGRYPKHSWPDDPLHATLTSRTIKRS